MISLNKIQTFCHFMTKPARQLLERKGRLKDGIT
jgi:hypothetical protein